MRLLRFCCFISFLALLSTISTKAQEFQPECGVTCVPAGNSETYGGGTMQARTLPRNARGGSSVFAPAASGSGANVATVVAGSESYNYAVPILSLPGRNGLNVSLVLFYNSRVWTIDPAQGTATFNADRDFPSYGFRLGYGYVEADLENGWARLKTAATTGSSTYPAWGLSWSYDRYGNRTAQSVTAGTAPSHSASVSATTNQFTGGYDAGGNMTADGVATMIYDAEGRMTQSTVAGAATTYLRRQRAAREARRGRSDHRVHLRGRAGDRRVSERRSGAGIHLLRHHDHLSIRLFTDAEGDVVGAQGHYPYGEGWYSTGSTTERLFTSYDHDDASADDYALHRFHNCRLGRFRTARTLSMAATTRRA